MALAVPSTTTAWASIPSVERPSITTTFRPEADGAPRSTDPAWRIALNFGRESSTSLLTGFGSSGARFPVVTVCEFTPEGLVMPRSDKVSYVADASIGSVSRPIEGGQWTVQENQNHDQAHDRLDLSLTFPEEISKKDIVIPADSTLKLEGWLYSQEALTELQQAFSLARQEEWKAMEAVDEIQAIRDAPKKWNEETKRWEIQRVDEPLTSLFSKNWNAFTKGQERRRRQTARPSNDAMSTYSGRFPGYDQTDDRVYMGSRGIIRNQSANGLVVGTWSAEPVKDFPASYSTYFDGNR